MLSINIAVEQPSGVETAARRAVTEMISNGAHFTVTRRPDGQSDFLWDLPKGGSRSACRRIIAEAKQNSAAYWHAFVAAIVEHAGGPAR